ncbi:MAG TPA: DUF4190 domain-containing protein [Candidatus Saccharibacteria bacterium]|mgnify:CR=1 FL=1|nr:DUF4190 domain-containing protein [Candidatus Saccharibacteria bacterium]
MDTPKTNKEQPQYNIVALIAFVTMWIPLVGPILGIIALVQIKKSKEKGRWMAISSIILPIIASIFFAFSIYFFITSAIKDTNNKAQRLNISTSEYNQINNAINGNCNIEALETGSYISDFSNTKSSNIDFVETGFAKGSRQCYNSTESKTFIAKQDNIFNDNSPWRVIFVTPTSEGLPCSLQEDFGVPESMLINCIKNSISTPVNAI